MSVKLRKAMTAAFIAGDFGLPIEFPNEHEDEDNPPAVGSPVVEVRNFSNPVTPLGLTASSETTGLLQFSLLYPAGTGAIPAEDKAQEIFDAFQLGQRLSYGGESLVLKAHHLVSAGHDKTRGAFKVVGRINYAALLPR